MIQDSLHEDELQLKEIPHTQAKKIICVPRPFVELFMFPFHVYFLSKTTQPYVGHVKICGGLTIELVNFCILYSHV